MPIKPATGWVNAPVDALEFNILVNNGLERRPCLILKNQEGIYDHVAIYPSKKSTEPLVILKQQDLLYSDVLEDLQVNGQLTTCSRQYLLYDLAQDGTASKFMYQPPWMLPSQTCFIHIHFIKKSEIM